MIGRESESGPMGCMFQGGILALQIEIPAECGLVGIYQEEKKLRGPKNFSARYRYRWETFGARTKRPSVCAE